MNIKFDPYISYNTLYTQSVSSSNTGVQKTGTSEEESTDKVSGMSSVSGANSAEAVEETDKVSSANSVSGAENSSPPEPKTPSAIASFMHKLGLTPTNTKEGDEALINAKLSELESAAQSDTQKQNVVSLREEFAALVAQTGSAGQNQTAALNKAMFNLN